MPRTDWSPEEVAAIVADYLTMLELELRGEDFNKSERNRLLRNRLNGRTAGSVEFKHANISAVLIELGHSYVTGYQPRYNYQQLLRDEVAAQLVQRPAIAELTATLVEHVETDQPMIRLVSDILVDPPKRVNPRAVYDRKRAIIPRPAVNYLEREARNSALGTAGEHFVVALEHRRLWDAGERKLAERIEHVAKTKGDGLGYDVVSFDADGRERLIEVKTTRFGQYTPFFASRREVEVSLELAPSYHIYRVFQFGPKPHVFIRAGSLVANFELEATQYRVGVA